MHDDVGSSISVEASSNLPFDVNERNRRGWTLLHRAVVKGREDVVQSLLENPNFVEVNTRTPDGDTALHLSALTGQMRMVELLLACPAADVNARSRGRKVCNLAAATDNKEIEAAILADPRYRYETTPAGPKLTKSAKRTLKAKAAALLNEKLANTPHVETGKFFAAGGCQSHLILAASPGQATVAAAPVPPQKHCCRRARRRQSRLMECHASH